MSTSVHAVADQIEGPYSKKETIVGTESHNTIYVYSPVDKVRVVVVAAALKLSVTLSSPCCALARAPHSTRKRGRGL